MEENELLNRYQIQQVRAEVLRENISRLELLEADLMNAINTLEELEKIKGASETYVPIGAGVFVKAVISETKELMFDVGANVLVKCNLEFAKSELKKRLKEIRERKERAKDDLIKAVEEMRRIEQEFKRRAAVQHETK